MSLAAAFERRDASAAMRGYLGCLRRRRRSRRGLLVARQGPRVVRSAVHAREEHAHDGNATAAMSDVAGHRKLLLPHAQNPPHTNTHTLRGGVYVPLNLAVINS
ncbi:unnamed protein product [Ixodes persulcatus]